MKRNWFNTLNEALDSEDLTPYWDIRQSVNYGEVVRVQLEIEGRYRTVSIFRESVGEHAGMYERPIHYDAGKI